MNDAPTAAADIINERAGFDPVEVAVVLGTGLGNVTDSLEDAVAIPYADLPGFPEVGVSGHDGRLVIGKQEGTRIAYMQGRSHYYEKGDSRCMAAPLETLALLGVHTLILTASVGSLKADFYPGTMVLITDHINFNGLNPLIGVANDGGFVSLTDAYDQRLIKRMKRATISAGVTLHEGVYMWYSGPSFETPAEIKMARMLGADVVGMSVVPEVILARRLALRVSGLAMVTNFGAGFQGGNPTHAGTRETAAQATIVLKRLIRSFLKTKEEAWTG